MISLLLLSLLSSWQDAKEIIFLHERVQIDLRGEIIDAYERDIYYDKEDKRTIRIDEHSTKQSYIFRTDPSMIIVLNHEDQSFSYGLVKHDRSLIRTMLKGLGYYVDGQLQQRAGNLSPTGLKRKISQWQCQEYALNYPSMFGIDTRIWCTSEKTILSKDDMRTLWYTIIGGSPSHDVNSVILQFFKDIPGVPIQFVTKIEQQDAMITIKSQITTMERRSNSNANLFEIPNNYRVIIRSASGN